VGLFCFFLWSKGPEEIQSVSRWLCSDIRRLHGIIRPVSGVTLGQERKGTGFEGKGDPAKYGKERRGERNNERTLKNINIDVDEKWNLV